MIREQAAPINFFSSLYAFAFSGMFSARTDDSTANCPTIRNAFASTATYSPNGESPKNTSDVPRFRSRMLMVVTS